MLDNALTETLTAELRPLIGAHADIVANHLVASGKVSLTAPPAADESEALLRGLLDVLPFSTIPEESHARDVLGFLRGHGWMPAPVSVPPGPCFVSSGFQHPGQQYPMRCDLRAGHAGAHEADRRPLGGTAVWFDQEAATEPAQYALQIQVNSGRPSAYWQFEPGEWETREHLALAWDDKVVAQDEGYRPEDLRVVAITVLPEPGEEQS